MKKFIIFILAGLPLSVPICILALRGFNGGTAFEQFIFWIALLIGMPWDLVPLGIAAFSAFSNNLGGNWLISTVIILTFVSISINCSFFVYFFGLLISSLTTLHKTKAPKDQQTIGLIKANEFLDSPVLLDEYCLHSGQPKELFLIKIRNGELRAYEWESMIYIDQPESASAQK